MGMRSRRQGTEPYIEREQSFSRMEWRRLLRSVDCDSCEEDIAERARAFVKVCRVGDPDPSPEIHKLYEDMSWYDHPQWKANH